VAKPITKKLADLHEEYLADVLQGRKTKSSGNQLHDPADGRNAPYSPLGFAWDCKCAMPGTKSISITREMLSKIEHESHGMLMPGVPIRFYESERGAVEHDWIAIRTEDLRALLDYALAYLEGEPDES